MCGNVSEADLSFISEAKLNGIPTKQLLDFAQGINLRVLSATSISCMEQQYLYPAIIDVYKGT